MSFSKQLLTNLLSAAAQTFIKVVDTIQQPYDTRITIYPDIIYNSNLQITVDKIPTEQYVAIQIYTN
jgi:hypothetical protein